VRRFSLSAVLSVLVCTSASVASAAQNSPQNNVPTSKSAGGSDASADIRNVHLRLTDRISIDIASMSGKLTPKSDQVVIFDDKQSFSIDIASANVRISAISLTNDLNDFVFAAQGAPLKKLSASIEGDQLSVKGLLASKGDIPFETVATLTLTPEGMIRVHPTTVKALKLPVKGLLDLLGLDAAKLLNAKKVEGVSLDKDDLIFDPQVMFPPPRLRGQLSGIAIQNGEIALKFGPRNAAGNQPPLKNKCGGRNYLQLEGGTVRAGKITMTDTDLTLVDADPADPFDFALDHYKEILGAGYVKMTAQGGVCVHMPDYDKIQRRRKAAP
jgi:hypothetical protein